MARANEIMAGEMSTRIKTMSSPGWVRRDRAERSRKQPVVKGRRLLMKSVEKSRKDGTA
jgi:hypothetical protein